MSAQSRAPESRIGRRPQLSTRNQVGTVEATYMMALIPVMSSASRSCQPALSNTSGA